MKTENKDTAIVKKITDYLESKNIKCWYAERDGKKQDNNRLNLVKEELLRSNIVLLILTQNMPDEEVDNIKNVLTLAKKENKTIIPLSFDETEIPTELEEDFSHLVIYHFKLEDDLSSLILRILSILQFEKSHESTLETSSPSTS